LQSRIGKRRSIKSNRRTRFGTLACVSGISLLASCATTPTKSIQSSTVAELNRFCFSGDGKVRVTSEGQRYVTSYESLFDKSKGKFIFAASVPGKGEEVLEMKLPQRSGEKATAQGAFLKEVEPKRQKELGLFVSKLASFLEIYRNAESDQEAYQCQNGPTSGLCTKDKQAVLTWRKEESSLEVLIPGRTTILTLTGENLGDSYYKKATIDFRNNAQNKNILKLELFLTNCK